MTNAPLNISTIQERLMQTRGREYWRSLEELAESEAFAEFLHREFPRHASEWTGTMSRRGFLQLMGASLALGGLTACKQPTETIVPYVAAPAANTPEESVPGTPLFFATAMTVGGYAQGVLVGSQMNRPTKIEGNPDHPASLGATDALAQASILTLYDPDRAQTVTQGGKASSWDDFLTALGAQMEATREKGGAGLHILTETITSPTLFSQLTALLDELPDAVWHQYQPVNRDNVYAGGQLAFGQAVEPVYDLAAANVILSLDADLFQSDPGRVRYARDFADGRRADRAEDRALNRLYVVESTPTITGTAADHRLPLRSSRVDAFARSLAAELGIDAAQADAGDDLPADWVGALARDLQANAGSSLVVAGDGQPPAVHALVHAINEALENVGTTVRYTAPVATNPANQSESLQALVGAMNGGNVSTLLILGGNPVYSSPADLNFADALAAVEFSAQLSLYHDETGALCTWHLPESHYLESWGDARAYDGTITIQQPLIDPLYDSRSPHELLDALLAEDPRSAHDIVQGYWAEQVGEENLSTFWQTTLHDGVVADSALPAVEPTLQDGATGEPPTASNEDGLELIFRPDPSLWDGRFANNGWLQELPKPITKLTWENAALLNPLTADALGLSNGDVVELRYDGQSVEAPVLLVPGHAQDAITVHLGYGRTVAGRVGNGAGFNAYALRTADAPWFGIGARVERVASGHRFAVTQDHHSMEGRNLVRVGTAAEFADNPEFVHELDPHGEAISLYPKFEYDDNAWGMAIDLSACIGCNACTVACQAENNIPIVGKEEVANGREMHWIRIDSYFEGDLLNPATHHQPVMCMHCENAPCEVVCPVGATMHDSEGLNAMVYNRCVGTRYCSNNCPYKVRRFNFLEYTDYDAESLKLMRNPNVTVRSRGVMEKCTYCVQRISAARIDAKVAGRELVDGDVVTACQAACPTKAIVFGDINNGESEVAARKASPLNYGLLTELNTHPRTTYLARIRNPNPELAD